MMQKQEYLVHIWGGAWNEDANPSIEKDLGIKKGYHYFDTEKEKDAFCALLNDPKYTSQGLMVDIQYGVMSHKRTIFVGTLKYKDDEFVIHDDFGYDCPEKRAVYMFTEGNYACDCNKSIFIRREYGENAIPLMECGHQIKLIDYHFEYKE